MKKKIRRKSQKNKKGRKEVAEKKITKEKMVNLRGMGWNKNDGNKL